MTHPESGSPENPTALSPARRRQAKRRLSSLRAEERSGYLDKLALVLSPGIGTYALAILSGAFIGIGYRMDQLVLFIVGMLVAPRLAPILGLAVATTLGRVGFFLRMLLTFLVMLALFGLTAGFSGGFWAGAIDPSLLLYTLININPYDFALVVIAAVAFTLRLTRDGQLSPLPSVALAYGVLLPFGAAAVGFVREDVSIWSEALLKFSLHLSWALAASAITFIALGFKPLTRNARSYLGSVFLFSLIVVLSLLSLGAGILVYTTPTEAPIVIEPTQTPTPTVLPTHTVTLTQTPVPTETPVPTLTSTPTVTPTPVVGVVARTGGVGVILRESPGGSAIEGLFDGMYLELIGGPVEIEGVVWIQVRTEAGEVGWLIGVFIATATPEPTLESQ
ncbi:MAG: DUF389 domain-containing protein [Anaerolineales bacterium]|nr:DUF389 domain-containing protein [Anaerolineales bacterium]